MSTSPEMQALETLVGEPLTREVFIDGKTVLFTIKQIKTGKIPKLAAAAGPILHILMDKQASLDLTTLALFHTSDCLNVLSILTDQPRAVIDEMELDDAVAVLTMCVERNLDFFVRRVLPLLSEGMARQASGLAARMQEQSGKTQPTP